jgi:hypothetical protein
MATGGSKANECACSICLEEFNDQRFLSCFHTFCRPCIQNYMDTKSENGRVICPLCQTESQVPETGAAGLQHNMYLDTGRPRDEFPAKCEVCDAHPAKIRCQECEQCYCTSCAESHRKIKAYREHHLADMTDTNALEKTPRIEYYSRHPKEPFRYFCMECQACICLDCYHTKHNKHSCEDIHDASETLRQDMLKTLSSTGCDSYLPCVAGQVSALLAYSAELENKMTDLEKQVTCRTEELHRGVDELQNKQTTAIRETFGAEIEDVGARVEMVREARMYMIRSKNIYKLKKI